MAQVTFSSSVGGDGSTVSDDKNPTTGLDDGGHRTRFVPALSQVVAVAANTVASANAAATSALNAANAPNVSATSTTNLTIGIGNKTLTVQTGKAFVVGMSVKIAETITPTNWMHGTVTAYNSSTGSLTVSVDNISGISTATGWTISGSAPSFLGISELLPISRPSLNLDFANSEQVDPRITFVRDTTATRFNELGLLELVDANEPRIDYDPVTGECLGLLIEGQRTNLLTYSEEFDNAAWTKTRSSITANATTAPDGTLTADKLVEDTSVGQSHNLNYSPYYTPTAGTKYTFSVYVKASGRTKVQVNFTGGAALSYIVYDLSLGQVVPGGIGDIVPVNNGWYRLETSLQAVDTTIGRVSIYLWDSTSGAYDGDGTSGIYIWGAQIEEGSFPTSYIPTTTTPVTRNADLASMTGTNFSDWYRQDEGTIVSEHEWFTTSDYGTVWGVSDGTSDNEMRLIGWNTSFDRSPTIWSLGTSQTDIISSYTSNKIYKYAISYKDDDIATSRDGDNPMTDSSATVPIVNSLSIGNTRGIAFELNGHIKNLKYYPVRLSNSELQTLTS